MAPNQQSAMVVDVNASRVYVFEHHDGDQSTPVGVYFITGKISSDALPFAPIMVAGSLNKQSGCRSESS